MAEAALAIVEEEGETKFDIGDRVRLKTGGPLMIVQDLYTENQVEAVWFEPRIDGTWEGPNEYRFNADVLEAIP